MSIESLLATAEEADFFEDLTEEQKATADMKAYLAITIHNKRTELKMTQEEFAKLNGVSQVMVSKWESGDYNFTVQTLERILPVIGLKLTLQPSDEKLPSVTTIESIPQPDNTKSNWTAYTSISTGNPFNRRQAITIA